jgi:hypothetical protein
VVVVIKGLKGFYMLRLISIFMFFFITSTFAQDEAGKKAIGKIKSNLKQIGIHVAVVFSDGEFA